MEVELPATPSAFPITLHKTLAQLQPHWYLMDVTHQQHQQQPNHSLTEWL